MLKRHYSPGIPMKLNSIKPDYKAAFIVFGKKYKMKKNMFNLSKNNNLKEAAKNLYKIFRKIKKLKYKKINVVKIPFKSIFRISSKTCTSGSPLAIICKDKGNISTG